MPIVVLLELWKISSRSLRPVAMPMVLGAEGQLRHQAPEIRGVPLARGIRGIILPAGPGRSVIGGKWKPGVLAAHSPWVPIACLLKGFCRTFCTDTQTLRLNCSHCHFYSLLYLYLSSSCLLHTWALPAHPSFGPSGQHGTCRNPQSCRQCRIAAVDEVASGWHNDRPKETEYCHVAPYNGCRSPFFVTFSSCEKTTNFYLPLGIAFLFLGVLRQQVRKRYVHYGREVYQNRGFYHKVIALRLQCTQDGAN